MYQKRLFYYFCFGFYPRIRYSLLYLRYFSTSSAISISRFVPDSVCTASFFILTLSYTQREAILNLFYGQCHTTGLPPKTQREGCRPCGTWSPCNIVGQITCSVC